MNAATPAWQLAPIGPILLIGAGLALAPLVWIWRRQRGAPAVARLRALTWATLFLTFDLVLFGAFTRLTDSGLGCPDWPGCYGSASPVGASAHIASAAAAIPTGPVTESKAWIEMTHRYLATAVGALITLLAALSWLAARRHRRLVSPWWATFTLAWVCLQGAFGALTVTMKLYPAIVTLHLLGGIGLLMLLAAQTQAFEPGSLALPRSLVAAIGFVLLLTLLQIALGGWVSTNYAVLACRDFPTCQGSWWPPTDFGAGFHLLRHLGVGADGHFLPFPALTAIHIAHRIGALVVFTALALLCWRLRRSGSEAARRWAWLLAGIAAWQFATGLSNVVLGWPLVAALAHTAGAAALAVALTLLLVQARRGMQDRPARRPVHMSTQATS